MTKEKTDEELKKQIINQKVEEHFIEIRNLIVKHILKMLDKPVTKEDMKKKLMEEEGLK